MHCFIDQHVDLVTVKFLRMIIKQNILSNKFKNCLNIFLINLIINIIIIVELLIYGRICSYKVTILHWEGLGNKFISA